jgi:PAS domain S-box-containing protein
MVEGSHTRPAGGAEPFDWLETVHELSGAVTRAAGLEEIYNAALLGLTRSLAVDRAAVLLLDDGMMRFKVSEGLSERYRKEVEGHSPWPADATNVETILVEDVRSDQRVEPFREALADEGVEALAFVPLVGDSALLGKFMLYYNAPHRFTPAEVMMAETIARQIGYAIHRRQVEAHLRSREEQLRLALECASTGIWEYDLRTGTLACSPDLQRIFGLQGGAATSTLADYLRVVHPLDRERVEAVIAGGAPDGRDHSIEFRVVRPDGTVLWIESRGRVLFDEHGNRSGITGICADITPRRAAEEERAQLLAREQAARAGAEAAEERADFLAGATAVLASSLDYETTLASVARLAVPRFADWCTVEVVTEDGDSTQLVSAHVDPEKVRWAEELRSRYPPDPAAPYGVKAVLRTGELQFYPRITDELLVASARDEEHLRMLRTLGVSSAIIVPMVARGRTIGAISFVTTADRRFGRADLVIAEHLARRAALAVDNARLYREAQEANRAKDEFLATLSHELRTPLNAILGWARLLRMGKLDEAAHDRALETIERNAQVQAQLVSDILDVSRIITGKLRVDLRPIVLSPVLDAALDSVRPAAEAKHIVLEAAFHEDPGPLLADASRLQQILWNLLSNAVKFTRRGGKVRLAVEARRAEGVACITVADNGAGIDQRFLPYVFDRFRQGDSTSTRPHGGLGLGLAIVRHLVELHGGSVEASSGGPNQGATFTVRLPLANAGDPAGPPSLAESRADTTDPLDDSTNGRESVATASSGRPRQ